MILSEGFTDGFRAGFEAGYAVAHGNGHSFFDADAEATPRHTKQKVPKPVIEPANVIVKKEPIDVVKKEPIDVNSRFIRRPTSTDSKARKGENG